jgi:putative CocE/NonD family hydrolase
MNKRLCMVLLWLIFTNYSWAQKLHFPKIESTDSIALAKQMPILAFEILSKYKRNTVPEITELNNLFKIEMLADRSADALKSITALRDLAKDSGLKFSGLLNMQYELFLKAKNINTHFKEEFAASFHKLINGLDDQSALNIASDFVSRNGIDELKGDFQQVLFNAKQTDTLTIEEATKLCNVYQTLQVYQKIEAPARAILKQDDKKRYIIQDSILIKTNDGATLSALIVRKRGVSVPLPAALFFFIYSNLERSLFEAKYAAAHGYIGIVADTRGKRLSPDQIVPYEYESKDVNTVIDWISKQSWSNGKVGMYGGSYSGFAQWAAAKHLHPALKTIVPYAAAIPGLGLPMENNVFLNANYQWSFYVTNNKYVDDAVNDDNQRWRNMRNNWYESGAAYRKIDSIDGTPNHLLQKWLQHPSYDKYWQDMVPYQEDFSNINIPVLTVTGYYDDGQISAIHYLKEHYRYNSKANHYLIIGPYDHFGAQRGGVPLLRAYKVDPVALINTREITFQWLDYILKNGQKPDILKDKINYEVMGANVWKHTSSIEKMNNKVIRFYLTNTMSGNEYNLSEKKPEMKSIMQEIDLADRQTSNNDYYPDPIIKKTLDRSNGLFFISAPFDKPVSVNGIFSGELKAIINKKDMDIGVVLYEVMPDGQFFQLSYFLGRASYAKDMSVRQLLHPGIKEVIPFSRTRLVSRQLSKGSRLLVVLNIDKNPFAQINYGTGKDVSDETIKDARIPLKIKWFTDSFVEVPVYE